jgi:hypothetical protein
MLQVFLRFLTFNVVSDHWAAYYGLLAVWILLVVAALFSVRSLEISTRAKVSWLSVIVFVPLFGLGVYSLRCLMLGDWSFLKPLLAPPRTAKKIAPR